MLINFEHLALCPAHEQYAFMLRPEGNILMYPTWAGGRTEGSEREKRKQDGRRRLREGEADKRPEKSIVTATFWIGERRHEQGEEPNVPSSIQFSLPKPLETL